MAIVQTPIREPSIRKFLVTSSFKARGRKRSIIPSIKIITIGGLSEKDSPKPKKYKRKNIGEEKFPVAKTRRTIMVFIVKIL